MSLWKITSWRLINKFTSFFLVIRLGQFSLQDGQLRQVLHAENEGRWQRGGPAWPTTEACQLASARHIQGEEEGYCDGANVKLCSRIFYHRTISNANSSIPYSSSINWSTIIENKLSTFSVHVRMVNYPTRFKHFIELMVGIASCGYGHAANVIKFWPDRGLIESKAYVVVDL